MDMGGGISRAMMARLAWAVLSAVLLGIWLWRRSRQTETLLDSRSDRTTAWLRGMVLLLCVFWSATWLILAFVRLPYPFELEWNGGSMRDHCERLLRGQPLYVPPGPDWFPNEYPPLYFWVSALLMRVTGGSSYVPMRAVSIVSTLGCACLLYLWVDRLNSGLSLTESQIQNPKSKIQNRVWGWIAAGLFLASYRFTGAWYDIERIDMLFLFLSLLGIYGLERSFGASWRSVFLAGAAALALSLAFLTKQQAVLFLSGGAAALAWRRAWQPLGVFALVAVVVCGGAVWALNAASGGWFGYYCFHVPLVNGVQAHLAMQYLLGDLPLYAPTLGILVISWLARRRLFAGAEGHGQIALLMAMLATGVLSSLLSRAHWGGDQNVLMTGYVFLGAAAGVLAGRWARIGGGTRAPLYGLILAQLLTLTYRPGAQLPSAANRAAGERFVGVIRGLEREGEVLCLDHGGLTTPRHFHIMALHDVMNTERRLPPSLAAALRARRYVALVTDAKPEPIGEMGEFARNYPKTECLDIGASWIVTGYPTPTPTRRVWVSRP